MAFTLDELGIKYTGGKNSPYIWLKCPNNMGSWEFFDYLLENANVGTPGAGFGKNSEKAGSDLLLLVTRTELLRLWRE